LKQTHLPSCYVKGPEGPAGGAGPTGEKGNIVSTYPSSSLTVTGTNNVIIRE